MEYLWTRVVMYANGVHNGYVSQYRLRNMPPIKHSLSIIKKEWLKVIWERIKIGYISKYKVNVCTHLMYIF